MGSHKGLWKIEGQYANNGELESEGEKAREDVAGQEPAKA